MAANVYAQNMKGNGYRNIVVGDDTLNVVGISFNRTELSLVATMKLDSNDCFDPNKL